MNFSYNSIISGISSMSCFRCCFSRKKHDVYGVNDGPHIPPIPPTIKIDDYVDYVRQSSLGEPIKRSSSNNSIEHEFDIV